MNNNKYIKAGIWYAVGNILIKGLPFMSIPIFVRIMPVSDFGIYNTYIYYESIVSVILGLGISGTIKTAKFEYKEDFDQYVSSVYVFLLIPVTVFILLSIILHQYLTMTIPWITSGILFILLLHSFSAAVYSINGVKYVIEGDYKKNLLISLVYTVLNIGVSLLLCLWVFDFDKYIGRITGTAFSMSVIAVIVLIFQLRKIKPYITKSYWNYAIKMGVPLVPHLLSLILLSSCDTIMIQSMIGSEEAGIYSLAVNLLMVLVVLQNSIENAWAPWFYSSLDKRDYINIKKRNMALIAFFSYLTICFMLIAPEVIRIFSTIEYKDSIYVLIPLALSTFWGFIYLIPVNVEYFHKKTIYISTATIATALVNIGLNYIFLTNFCYIAAAYATCISKLILLYIHICVAKRLDKKVNMGSGYGMMISLVVIAFGALTILFQDIWLIRWGIVIFFSLVVGIAISKKRWIRI